MYKINLLKISLSILVGFSLNGCGSNVDKVKDGILDFDKSITVSKAFDNWKSCKNPQWSEFVTDNGKNMVEFNCEAVDIHEYMHQVKTTYASIVTLEQKWYPATYEDKYKQLNYKITSEIFTILKSTYTIQWIINKDNTFETEYIGVTTKWNDSKIFEKSLSINKTLNSVYENESIILFKQLNALEYDISNLTKKYSHYLPQYKNLLLKDMFIYYNHHLAK